MCPFGLLSSNGWQPTVIMIVWLMEKVLLVYIHTPVSTRTQTQITVGLHAQTYIHMHAYTHVQTHMLSQHTRINYACTKTQRVPQQS